MILAKKIVLVTGIVFIAIQFFHPALNKSYQFQDTDISKMVATPNRVLSILKNDCYDCHSNHTVYPWYSHIQPVGWWLALDIKNAKEQLNFSEFGSYSTRRQLSKLDEIANSIKDNIMPLFSYKLMHKNAQLSTEEKALLINWAQQAKDILTVKN